MNYQSLSIVGGRLVNFRPGMPHNQTVPSSAAHAISRKRSHIREAADEEQHVKMQARRRTYPSPHRTSAKNRSYGVRTLKTNASRFPARNENRSTCA